MASPAQILANRNNAQFATGPRTAEGKAHSASNSRKHGLTSREIVLQEGDQPEFDQMVESLAAELTLASELENLTFANLVHAAWTLRRCRRAEAALAATADPFTDDDAARRQQAIQRYAGQAERSYYRALKELKALHTSRALHQILAAQENDAQQNEPIPTLADVPTLLKTGWRPPEPPDPRQEEWEILRRQQNQLDILRREQYYATLQQSGQQNEANSQSAA
jgi:hypothetical protein